MIPKEKALDLIATYRYILSLPNAPLGDKKDAIAKQCALIAVDEVIKYSPNKPIYEIDTIGYFQKVKQEIEAL